MEYQPISHMNPFSTRLSPDFFQDCSQNSRYPPIPVQLRLQENKERRLQIQRQKLLQKQIILQRRRQKEQNVQKALKSRLQAKQNAQYLLSSMNKTSSSRFESNLAQTRGHEIDERIQQCRTRADQYRTLYKRKLHDQIENRETSVRQRRKVLDKEERERSLEYHMNQWREYEKKTLQKYKGEEINYNRLYENFLKKQQNLKDIMEQYKDKQQIKGQNKLKHVASSNSFKKLAIQRPLAKKKTEQKEKSLLPSNPVYSHPGMSSFGLTKSVQNPDKMLRDMKKFLEEHVMMEEPTNDEKLILKFEQFLQAHKDS